MLLNKTLIKEFEFFCETIIKKAGQILLEHQNKFQVVNQKDIKDIATTADIASERFIIKSILERYPDHNIVSEEEGEINNKSEFKWIIDPLDGTKEYVRSIPLWNCSMALQFKDEAIVSAVYRPQENTFYSATKGNGSFKNGKRINVSSVNKLEESFVYCYIPSYKRQQDKYDWTFNKLALIGKKVYRLRSLCDINTALSWLAQGGYEAFINLGNPEKIHDILPGLLIAKEAGAYNAENKIPLVVANNRKIYNELVKLINI